MRETLERLFKEKKITLAVKQEVSELIDEHESKEQEPKLTNFDLPKWKEVAHTKLNLMTAETKNPKEMALQIEEMRDLIHEITFSDKDMETWVNDHMEEACLSAKKGEINLTAQANTFANIFAYCFWDVIKDTENYVDISFVHPDNYERIHVWVLRNGKLNPNQKKIKILKERLSCIKDALAKHSSEGLDLVEQTLGSAIDDFSTL